jgi:ATP-dependent Lon protease
MLDTIPGPLRDRMEIIELAGYTEEEKLNIARRYLIPKQLKEHGITEEHFEMDDEHLRKVIQDYTREAGVRNLERELGALCRRVAKEVASGKEDKRVADDAFIVDVLGAKRYSREVKERTSRSGVATGLAWTAVGGDILFIEATKMPGKGGLVLTGKLGDVMKESAQAALSYVKSNSAALGIPIDDWGKWDIHIHIPAGAVPKDGPSAGVTMFSALVSLLTGRHVRHDVAMTGEITLRGAVLPVGGIKEKVLAAKRAGISHIVLPKHNEKDIAEIEAHLKEGMTFDHVEEMSELLPLVLSQETDPPAQQLAVEPKLEEVMADGQRQAARASVLG